MPATPHPSPTSASYCHVSGVAYELLTSCPIQSVFDMGGPKRQLRPGERRHGDRSPPRQGDLYPLETLNPSSHPRFLMHRQTSLKHGKQEFKVHLLAKSVKLAGSELIGLKWQVRLVLIRRQPGRETLKLSSQSAPETRATGKAPNFEVNEPEVGK